MAEKKKKELKEINYEIVGTFIEKGSEKKFTKQVKGFNENTAKENLYALMGSKHKLKRRTIKINEVKSVKE